jgi:hypothetical protein
MFTPEIRRLGRQASSQKVRAAYDAKPNHCLYCDAPILSVPTKRLAETRAKKFCNHSCAASYNNLGVTRNARVAHICSDCGARVSRTNVRCRNCAVPETFSLEEKGNLYHRYGEYRAKVRIRNHARITYKRHLLPVKCYACDYSHHIEVCHKTAISDFSDLCTVKEINAPNNLIGLCPNCHWELDNGLLSL